MEDEPVSDHSDKQATAYAELVARQWSTTSNKPGDTIWIEEFLQHAVNAGNYEFAVAASVQFLKELEDPKGNPAIVKICAKDDDGSQLLWLARSAKACRELAEELLRIERCRSGEEIRQSIQLALQFRGEMHYIVEFVSGRSKLAGERVRQLTRRGRGNAKLTDSEWHDVLDSLVEMVRNGDAPNSVASKTAAKTIADRRFPQ